jgi:chaperonin GroES
LNIIPLFDRVLVRVEAYSDPDASESSIVTPDVAQEKPETGVVIAVGDGRILPDGTLRPLALKAGDWVLFGSYAGQDVKTLKDHVLIREDECLAVIN